MVADYSWNLFFFKIFRYILSSEELKNFPKEFVYLSFCLSIPSRFLFNQIQSERATNSVSKTKQMSSPLTNQPVNQLSISVQYFNHPLWPAWIWILNPNPPNSPFNGTSWFRVLYAFAKPLISTY